MIAHDIVLSRRAVLTGIAGLVIGIVLPEVASARQSGAARTFAPGTGSPAQCLHPRRSRRHRDRPDQAH
jgi:hypothetical protein